MQWRYLYLQRQNLQWRSLRQRTMSHAPTAAIPSRPVVTISKIKLYTFANLKSLYSAYSCFPWITRIVFRISTPKTKLVKASPVSARAARLAWLFSISKAASILARTPWTITNSRMIAKTRVNKVQL